MSVLPRLLTVVGVTVRMLVLKPLVLATPGLGAFKHLNTM